MKTKAVENTTYAAELAKKKADEQGISEKAKNLGNQMYEYSSYAGQKASE